MTATLDRVRVVALRQIAAGVRISRATLRIGGCRFADELIGDMLDALVAEGTIRPEHLARTRPVPAKPRRDPRKLPAPLSRSPREEERVELPPPRRFEMPEPAVKHEPSLWQALRAAYWSEARRALYRRGLA